MKKKVSCFTLVTIFVLISGTLVPSLILNVVAQEPVYDVEAISQTASSTDVTIGESVDIEVTVRNNGDSTETFNVVCQYQKKTVIINPRVSIGTILFVDVAPGEIRIVTFTWDTNGVTQGTYSITAWADSGEILNEVDEENNWCTMPLEITIREPVIPPVASFSTGTPIALVFADVMFDASSSYDPDGTIVLYEWDWDGDGTYDETNSEPTGMGAQYTLPGTYDVGLRVTDNEGLTDTTTLTVTILSQDDFNKIPEVPFGTIMIVTSMGLALFGYIAIKKPRKNNTN